MLKKAMVQLIEKGNSMPFDIASSRTIIFDHHDMASVEDAKKELAEQIMAAELDPTNVDNPISIAMDLRALIANAAPEGRIISESLTELSVIRRDIIDIKTQIELWGNVKYIDRMFAAINSLDNEINGLKNDMNTSSGVYDLDDLHDKMDDLVREIEQLKKLISKR